MKLEDQVTNLELSKKLKELGVKQESYFYWVITMSCDYHISIYDGELPEILKSRNDCYSAFTVAELGEMLPFSIFNQYGNNLYLELDKFQGELWNYYYSGADHYDLDDKNYEKSEADARAVLLIRLIKNKLIKL